MALLLAGQVLTGKAMASILSSVQSKRSSDLSWYVGLVTGPVQEGVRRMYSEREEKNILLEKQNATHLCAAPPLNGRPFTHASPSLPSPSLIYISFTISWGLATAHSGSSTA